MKIDIKNIIEPTGEQCSRREVLWEDEDEIAWASFSYPQMGGYGCRSIVVAGKIEDGCFDIYIWHDGEFPFGGKPPVELHHCSAEQFIQFGREVLTKQTKEKE